MRTALAVIIFCIFLPFLAFAADMSSDQSTSSLNGIFGFLDRSLEKTKSYAISKAAEEKESMSWAKDHFTEFYGRAIRTISSISGFIREKAQAVFSFIENKLKEKIGENIWALGEKYVKNSLNYINKKIQN